MTNEAAEIFFFFKLPSMAMTTNGSVLNSVTEFMKEFSGVLFPPPLQVSSDSPKQRFAGVITF